MDAVFDSVSVAKNFYYLRINQNILLYSDFCQKSPSKTLILVKKYLGNVIPTKNHFFATLNHLKRTS